MMEPSTTETPPRRSLLNTAAIYVVSNILSAAIPFLLMPVLTRSLLPGDYGITAMFATVLAVLSSLVGLSVHGAVSLRYFRRESFDLPRYVGTALMLLGVSTAVLLVIMLLAGGLLNSWVQVPVRWLIAAVLVAGANFVGQVRLVLWQAEARAFRYLIYSVASSFTNLVVSIVLVVAADMRYAGRLTAITTTSMIFAVIAVASLRRDGLVKFSWDSEAANDALRFGIPLIPHSLGGLLIALADRVLVTKMVGVAHTGIYIVGAQLGMIIGILADASSRAYSPWLFGRLANITDEEKARIVRMTYAYFVGITALALSLAGIAPYVLRVLLGARFVGAGEYILWFALAGAFQGMYLMVTNYIFYVKRTELLSVVTFVTGALNILLNYVLIRRNGALGAAEATCAAYLFSFLATWFVAARVYDMPWFRRSHS